MSWRHLSGGVRRPSRPTEALPRAVLAGALRLGDLPDEVFLAPPPYQPQADANSCTAHGFSSPVEALTRQELGAAVAISRMDLYYGARFIDGWQNRDSGALMSSMVRWMQQYGCASEATWPYDPKRVTDMDPPAATANERRFHRVGHSRLSGALSIAAALAGADGRPARGVAWAHPVADSYVGREGTARDGWFRALPLGVSPWSLGWHCTWLCGYSQHVVVPGFGPGAALEMNSWDGWGIAHPTYGETFPHGFAWVPFDLLNDEDFNPEPFAPDGPLPVEV